MTGPTACKNNPIATAEHTPLVPPRSSCGFGNKKTHAKTVVFLLETISRAPSRRDAASCAASSAHRAFQRGAVPLSVPLADAAVTQADPPGTLPRSAGCGVVTSTRSMCATWWAFGCVELQIRYWFGGLVRDWTAAASWAAPGQSPIGASLVRGRVVFLCSPLSSLWEHTLKRQVVSSISTLSSTYNRPHLKPASWLDNFYVVSLICKTEYKVC